MLSELVGVRMEDGIHPPTVVASSTYIGPGPLPNIEREGSQQRPIRKGQLVQLILTKVVFAYERLWW